MVCASCGATLETPLGCGACGLLRETGELSPFEVFGLEPGSRVDAADLRRRFLRFTRITHPDFFGTRSQRDRELAERNTARLNEAHATLADDAARIDHLVRSLGGPSESEERQMPKAFLMEVLEWNEALDEARHGDPRAPIPASLVSLQDTWKSERRTALDAALALLTPLPERGSPRLADARAHLNAVRYLDRALSTLEALRLSKAAAG